MIRPGVRSFLVLLLLTGAACLSFAQDDSLRSYYPLEIGNVWQYRVPEGPGRALWTVAVLGDTQLSSGKSYRIVEDTRAAVGRYYERIDSATLNVYRTAGEWDTEHLRDSLRAAVGDTLWDLWGSGVVVVYTDLSQDTVLGMPVTVKNFMSLVIPDLPRYGLAQGLGRSYEKTYVEDPILPVSHEVTARLQYAKIGGVEYGTLLSVGTDREVPRTARLLQNYPNPFNPSTKISYRLDGEHLTTLKIYDLLGTEVATLVEQMQQPGEHSATWNAQGRPSGVYFYRLTAGRSTETRAMLLLR